MLPLLRCFFFAHLLILQYPDHHQNLISSYLCYSGPFHKISSQSVHNFLSNVVHRQTDRQTNQRYQKHNLLCQGGNKQTNKQTNQRYQKHNLLCQGGNNEQCRLLLFFVDTLVLLECKGEFAFMYVQLTVKITRVQT